MYDFIRDEQGVTATEYCLLISISGGTAFIYLNRYAANVAFIYEYISGVFAV